MIKSPNGTFNFQTIRVELVLSERVCDEMTNFYFYIVMLKMSDSTKFPKKSKNWRR